MFSNKEKMSWYNSCKLEFIGFGQQNTKCNDVYIYYGDKWNVKKNYKLVHSSTSKLKLAHFEQLFVSHHILSLYLWSVLYQY